jgi:O-antigen/teichoic acid export membrane protein
MKLPRVQRLLAASPISRRLLARSGLTLALRIFGVALAYASNLVLSRLLGLHDYGIYVILLGWALLLSVPARLGFDTSALRYATVYLEQADWPALRAFVSLAFGGVTVLSMLVALGMIVFGRSIAVSTAATDIFWASTIIVPTALTGLLSAMMLAAKKFFAAQFFDQLFRPALILVFVGAGTLVGGAVIRTHEALMITSAASASAALALLIVFASVFRHSFEAPPDFSMTFSWLRVSLPLLVITGVQELTNQLQIIMLGGLAHARDAGLYAAAWRLASLMSFGLSALSTVSGPMIASAYHRGEFGELGRLASLSARIALAFAVPAAIVLVLAGPTLLSLFGRDFVAGYPVLLVLIAGALANAFTGVVAYLLTLTGREVAALVIFAGALALSAALNVLLIPHCGAVGAAVASAAGTIFWNMTMLILVRRHLGIDASALAWRSRAPRDRRHAWRGRM